MSAAANSMSPASDSSVRRSVTVKTTPQHAFEVFTADFDSWWPRSHHIGKSPMKRAIIESRLGGRCYSEQADGTDCDWGEITAWEPPRRFVMAWKINLAWQYEPDLAKSSEVEIQFIPLPDGSTRVDLEHRHFERAGEGWEKMRDGVAAAGGWGTLLELFAVQATKST
jgi:uncharacterized protein YndB with AHSA1/START domain